MGKEEAYEDTVLLVTPEEMPKERLSQFSVLESAKDFHEKLQRFSRQKKELADRGLMFGGRVLLIGSVGTDFETFIHHLAREIPISLVRVRLERVLSRLGQMSGSAGIWFEFARRNAPCILYFERIENLARQDSHESTMLTLELERVSWDEDEVLVVASTSKPREVDRELLSTFDTTYLSDGTTLEDRVRLMESILRGRNNLDPGIIAEITEGRSFQEMKHIGVDLLMKESDGDEPFSREQLENIVEDCKVLPVARKRHFDSFVSRAEGRQPPTLEAAEQAYPDDFLDQLYLLAVGNDYQQTQKVIETLNSGLPLSAQDHDFLSDYPFLLKGTPEDRLTRLLRAKKSNDRLRRIMGR
ncbi:MAG: AAA family ATPase [Candidatus Hermodarchaeota archaeon]